MSQHVGFGKLYEAVKLLKRNMRWWTRICPQVNPGLTHINILSCDSDVMSVKATSSKLQTHSVKKDDEGLMI